MKKEALLNITAQIKNARHYRAQMAKMSALMAEVGGRFLYTVHDSVVFSLPKDNVKLLSFLERWPQRRDVEEKTP